MKDYLLDLVEHTHALGIIDLVKIVGTDTETEFGAYSDDQTVVISGSFKTPISEFAGTFGMPNLSKLKTIISFDEYDDKAKINLVREDRDGEKDVPVRIHFETATGDFVNDYRLMLKYIVEDKVKNVKFKGATWDVEFEPTVVGINRLKKQASANSEEPTFNTKTDNGDLKIYFGDISTHSGNFVFQPGVTGTLSRAWNWPVKVFLAIMDLSGDKKIRMADAGAVEIVVDSGLATYRYLLPAQAK
jgi:GTP cyclohydrolase II